MYSVQFKDNKRIRIRVWKISEKSMQQIKRLITNSYIQPET